MSDSSNSSPGANQLFPITLRHAGSTYARKLRDVDGFYLIGERGNFLNVYNVEMKEALQQKKIRAIHHLRKGYFYFVQTEEQLRRFRKEREDGSDLENVVYWVYFDPE